MSLFTRIAASQRLTQSEPARRIYMDAPVTIRASQIDDIATALRESSRDGSIAVYANGRQVPTAYYSVTDSIYASTNFDPIRSISLHNEMVDVWFAWAASAQSRSTDPRYLGALWRVHKIMEGAKWNFGTFLARNWGAFVGVLAAILVILFTLDVRPPSQRDAIALSASIGAVVVVGLTVVIVWFRRVRFDIRARNERGKSWVLDALLQVVFYPAAALMLSAAVPLGISWWNTITGMQTP